MNHEHCEHCYDIRTCALLSRDNGSCKIVSCGLNCGARFHLCKLVEHQLLCPNEKVPCINKSNGCPAVVYRCQKANHLKTCPVKLAQGALRLNSWPMLQDTRVATLVGGDISLPAGSFTCQTDARDEVKDMFKFEFWLENLKHTSPQNEFSTLANFIKDSEVSEVFCGRFVSDTVITEYATRESAYTKFNKGTIPYGCFNKMIYHFDCEQNFGMKHSMCHSINVHHHIYGCVKCWIEHKCPLSYEGCTYSLRRMDPVNKDSCNVQDSFSNVGLTSLYGYCESTSDGMESSVRSSLERGDEAISESYAKCKRRSFSLKSKPFIQSTYCTGLLDLPLELLRDILMYLDPYSIRNAALTCKTLHNVSRTVVQKKGIVVMDWKKVTDGYNVWWTNPTTRWMFPPSFAPIRSWDLEVTSGAMIEHLKKCPYTNESD